MKQLTLEEVKRIFSSPLTWDNLPATAKERPDLGLLLINDRPDTFTIWIGKFTSATRYNKTSIERKLLHCTAYYRPISLDEVDKKGKFHAYLSKDNKLSIFYIGDIVKVSFQEKLLTSTKDYEAEKPLTVNDAYVSGIAIARRGDLFNTVYTLSVGGHHLVLNENELIESKVLAEQMEAQFNETKM